MRTLELVQILKALGDDTRLRITNILKYGPLCVCEIEEVLNLSQSNVSRHLSKLMNVKLVTYYKEAKYVYYKIDNETIQKHPFIKEIIDNEMDKITNLSKDCEKLKVLKRQGITCENIKEIRDYNQVEK